MLILGSTTRDPELIGLGYDLSLEVSKALIGILACFAALEELVSNHNVRKSTGRPVSSAGSDSESLGGT